MPLILMGARQVGKTLAVRVSMSPYSVQKVSIPATKATEAGAYTLLDIPLSAVCRVASECAAICERGGIV